MKNGKNILLFVIFLLIPSFLLGEKYTYYVSTKGSDNAVGTLKSPFKTPEKALEIALKYKVDSVEILFREGTYQLENSVRITGENIVLRPYKQESVSFMGGVSIERKQIKAVSDEKVRSRLQESVREKVKEIDLKSLGIKVAGITPKGFGRAALPSWSELFINGKPLKISRWPNDSTVLIGKVHCTGDM